MKEIRNKIKRIKFGSVVLHGISTNAGYLMPNPVFTQIKYMICNHIL